MIFYRTPYREQGERRIVKKFAIYTTIRLGSIFKSHPERVTIFMDSYYVLEEWRSIQSGMGWYPIEYALHKADIKSLPTPCLGRVYRNENMEMYQ